MASITASPLIVPIILGLSKGVSRITWSTGDNTRGKVFVSVVGKPGETQVDGGPKWGYKWVEGPGSHTGRDTYFQAAAGQSPQGRAGLGDSEDGTEC